MYGITEGVKATDFAPPQTLRRLTFEAIVECGRIMIPPAEEGAVSQVSGELRLPGWTLQDDSV
jgi:hypothetical protein